MASNNHELTIIDISKKHLNNIILIDTGKLCAKKIVMIMGNVLINNSYVVVGTCNQNNKIYNLIENFNGLDNILRITFDDSVTLSNCKALLTSFSYAVKNIDVDLSTTLI